jgi:hypothetical protein
MGITGKHPRLLLGFVLALAALLTFLKVPLASSQGITLVVEYRPGDLPLKDPDAALWQETTAIEVPLSAQIVTKPILTDTRVKAITARALHNGKQIAILVEWADETQNASMVRVQDFHDSVAVQFPVVRGTVQPFFCMGQVGGNVNIWFWRADWQADITARQDMETAYPNMYTDQYPFADPQAGLQAGPGTYVDPNYLPAFAAGNPFANARQVSPVEEVNAGGFGTLKSQIVKDQNVQGYGAWADGKWRVIFSRELIPNSLNDAVFAPGVMYSTAFAAWDGANGERNGQKSTSQWVSLNIVDMPTTPAPPAAQAVPAAAVSSSFDMSGPLLATLLPIGAVCGLTTLLVLGIAGAAVLSRSDEK